MLYVTTLNNSPKYTQKAVLAGGSAPDGGLYVPASLPQLELRELQQLRAMEYPQRVAWLLGLFFEKGPDGGEVARALQGWKPRSRVLDSRTALVPMWLREDGTASDLLGRLLHLLDSREDAEGFAPMAVWIALCGGLLCASGTGKIVAAASDTSFRLPLALWCLEQMGFGVQHLVYACKQSELWDLLYSGQLHFGRTTGPVPLNLERLIWLALGSEPAVRMYWARRNRTAFQLAPAQMSFLQNRLTVRVIGADRSKEILPRIPEPLSLHSAQTYCGILDYRAAGGAKLPALLFAPVSYGAQAGDIQKIMNRKAGE